MKILWLKTELLHPVDKGGKIRTYQMLKELKKDHEITYLTLDDGSAEPRAAEMAGEYCNEVLAIPHKVAEKFSGKFYMELAANSASRLPYALQKYVSAGMRSAIRDAVRAGGHDVLVCDFLAPAVNVPNDPGIPTLLFQHNVEAMIWRRHYEVAGNAIKQAFFKKQWRRMFEYEKEACKRFDRVVAVSREDSDTMRTDYGVDRVSDVPTGVDTEYFRADDRGAKQGRTVVFTGSMDWLPNEDAIAWFTDSIWPTVREQVQNASLVVVGRNPFPSLLELAERDDSVTVTGRVPDVRPYMSDARVFIVPMRIGGGTRLKIYEAMAMRLPVVSTKIGAEGLPLQDGKEILLRDDPTAFAQAVIELLKNEALAEQIGQAGEHAVREKYGWSNAAAYFAEQCRMAVEHSGDAEKQDAPAAHSVSVSA